MKIDFAGGAEPVQVYIGEEEWDSISMDEKIRLLNRLKSSQSFIASQMIKPMSRLIQREIDECTIDIDATIKRCEG